MLESNSLFYSNFLYETLKLINYQIHHSTGPSPGSSALAKMRSDIDMFYSYAPISYLSQNVLAIRNLTDDPIFHEYPSVLTLSLVSIH